MTSPTSPDVAAAAEIVQGFLVDPGSILTPDDIELNGDIIDAVEVVLDACLSFTAPPEPARLDDGGWRDISTAPKDGTSMLVSWGGTGIGIRMWSLNFDEWFPKSIAPEPSPMFWMPLPLPPKSLGVPLAAPGYRRPYPVDDVYHEPKAKR